ncbi:MAG: hypothetical protein FWD36_02335 [Treponema sp.]|nr:hypothetical protein [Treponema sp.]
MVTSAAWLVMLAVFSGLAMNIILQFGLDLKGAAFNKAINREGLLVASGIFFVAVIALWLVFAFIRAFLFLGFLEYVFLFPVSALMFSVLEYLMQHFIAKRAAGWRVKPLFAGIFAAGAPVGGASIAAALFITLNIANNFLEVIILALGFTLGIALAIVVVGEIRRRSKMEAVPRWLRGGPLSLISMGLLSLICSSGAIILFEVLGAR